MRRQKGLAVWFTGLSGAGKTTVAGEVERRIKERGLPVQRLDGDICRRHLGRDLGFSRADREENILRNTFVASLLVRNEIITLCSFITPYRELRRKVRNFIEKHGSYLEIYVNAPLEVCERRDVKGLYRRARAGEISDFTGISDPYEPPRNPDLELRTDRETVVESGGRVISLLEKEGFLPG